MRKTIVFCTSVNHAERMRQALINDPANTDLVQADHRYVMRITGDDDEGKAQLDNFIDPKRSHPVIATTSKLLSTGVDAQTCHVIVLDQRIQSLTEFKQTIGRGTRLRPDYGKYYFTILDFRKATELFADPDWDGPAIKIYVDPGGDDPIEPVGPDIDDHDIDDHDIDDPDIDEIIVDPDPVDPPDPEGRVVYTVSGVPFTVIAERVQYYDRDGKLITESLNDYTRNAVQQQFRSLDEFLRRWSEADRKQAIVEELLEHGVIIEALEDQIGRDLDVFDLICHVAFDQPPLTRRERADNVKKRGVFTKYGDTARQVLEALIDKYADQGVDSIEDIQVLKLEPFTGLGTPIEIVRSFGGKDQYQQAVRELQTELYGIAS